MYQKAAIIAPITELNQPNPFIQDGRLYAYIKIEGALLPNPYPFGDHARIVQLIQPKERDGVMLVCPGDSFSKQGYLTLVGFYSNGGWGETEDKPYATTSIGTIL